MPSWHSQRLQIVTLNGFCLCVSFSVPVSCKPTRLFFSRGFEYALYKIRLPAKRQTSVLWGWGGGRFLFRSVLGELLSCNDDAQYLDYPSFPYLLLWLTVYQFPTWPHGLPDNGQLLGV